MRNGPGGRNIGTSYGTFAYEVIGGIKSDYEKRLLSHNIIYPDAKVIMKIKSADDYIEILEHIRNSDYCQGCDNHSPDQIQ